VTADPDPVIARISRFWDARAREDARRYSLPGAIGDTGPGWEDAADDVVERLTESLGWSVVGAGQVLDVGCGAGRLTGALVDRADEVVGCDVSPTMLEHARARHQDAPRIRWERRHAADLHGFDDERTDAIIALGVVPHLPGAPFVAEVLAEFARVLAPGGRAVFDVRTGPDPMTLPGESPLPERVTAHPLWRGCVLDLETVAALAHQEGLVVDRIAGSETPRAVFLVRPDEG